MARWKLLQPHYLNIPGTKWEYTETDRGTGRPIRKQFDVPTYLHPDWSTDWNYRLNPDEGEIIVTNKFNPDYPKDYVFLGPPTPDMQPLDDEAKTISASFSDRWVHPIESLPAQGGYSQVLLDGFQREVADAQSKSSEAVAAQAEGMKEILATMAAMMKQNQELISTLVAAQPPAQRRA